MPLARAFPPLSLQHRALCVAAAAALVYATHSTARGTELPTLEDAGYAFEAVQQCDGIALTKPATRRLKRQRLFRNGRRMFKSAAERWGERWACETARTRLGAAVDLTDFASGKLIVQPPPDQIPPLPLLKADVLAGRARANAE